MGSQEPPARKPSSRPASRRFYNVVGLYFPLPSGYLKPLVFHLLNLFYIALVLKIRPRQQRGPAPAPLKHSLSSTVLLIIWHYGFQSFFGLSLAMLLQKFFFPLLPDNFGMLFTLGFALGPGQAYQMASQWQDSFGNSLGDLGLSFGGIGYIVAAIGGLVILNTQRKEAAPYLQSSFKQQSSIQQEEIGSSKETLSHIFTSKLAIILCTYGLSLLFLESLDALAALLSKRGAPLLASIMPTLHSITFVFAALAAMLVKAILRPWAESGKKPYIIEQEYQCMNVLSSSFIDILVCAGVGSISFNLLSTYMAPILLLVVPSAVTLMLMHIYIAKRIFRYEALEHNLVIFGGMTGTTSTGMALLSKIDPYYESRAAQAYLMATGFAFAGLLPLILTEPWLRSGQTSSAWWVYLSYFLISSLGVYFRINEKRRALT